jgi:hypothetical protein
MYHVNGASLSVGVHVAHLVIFYVEKPKDINSPMTENNWSKRLKNPQTMYHRLRYNLSRIVKVWSDKCSM